MAALAFLGLVLSPIYVSVAVRGDAFALHRLFTDRYVIADREIAASTPVTATVVSLRQSGSLRNYADRDTVRYDVLPPRSLDRVVAYLTSHQRLVFLALEQSERDTFVDRFDQAGQSAVRVLPRTVDPLGIVTLSGPLTTTQR